MEFFGFEPATTGDNHYLVTENHNCDWAQEQGLSQGVSPTFGIFKVEDGQVSKVK